MKNKNKSTFKQVKSVNVTSVTYGQASLRSYFVSEIIENGQDLEIVHDGQSMIIPNELISKLGKWSRQEIKSKFGQNYFLVGFPWKPDGRSDSSLNLFEGGL